MVRELIMAKDSVCGMVVDEKSALLIKMEYNISMVSAKV